MKNYSQSYSFFGSLVNSKNSKFDVFVDIEYDRYDFTILNCKLACKESEAEQFHKFLKEDNGALTVSGRISDKQSIFIELAYWKRIKLNVVEVEVSQFTIGYGGIVPFVHGKYFVRIVLDDVPAVYIEKEFNHSIEIDILLKAIEDEIKDTLLILSFISRKWVNWYEINVTIFSEGEDRIVYDLMRRRPFASKLIDVISLSKIEVIDMWHFPKEVVFDDKIRGIINRRNKLIHTGKIVDINQLYRDLLRIQAISERLLLFLLDCLNMDKFFISSYRDLHSIYELPCS